MGAKTYAAIRRDGVLAPTASHSYAHLAPDEPVALDAFVRAPGAARVIREAEGIACEVHRRTYSSVRKAQRWSWVRVAWDRWANMMMGAVASRVADDAPVPVTLVE